MVPELWIWRVGNLSISAGCQSLWKGKMEHTRFCVEDAVVNHIENFGKKFDIEGTEVVSILSDVDKYVDETRPSSIKFKKERNFLHNLSDIRSELVMILYVLGRQKKVLNIMRDGGYFDEVSTLRHVRGIVSVLDSIENYEGRINKINGDAERVEKAIQDMLELKRTYASIKDTHSSLLLSTAVIGFTVITIVFAPLAFLTALFALKIDGFEKLQVNGSDPGSAYKSSYIMVHSTLGSTGGRRSEERNDGAG
ncbi:hypothetical protein MMC17_001831 [Xylographa soralifera]|nr:hypothetical protein [Xylographa soralifera]